MMSKAQLHLLSDQLLAALTNEILPFHMQYGLDRRHHSFHGSVNNDLMVQADAPVGVIQVARMLWTYATAYRALNQAQYLAVAEYAYRFLTHHLYDQEHGGFFWSADKHGHPLQTHKLTYAQAFAIYGLAEFYRATEHGPALALAHELFQHLEQRCPDGYVEGFHRDWWVDSKLQVDEYVTQTVTWSMNTHLHLVEAYANLFRADQDQQVKRALTRLVWLIGERMYDAERRAFIPWLSANWQPLSDTISYGHDIETSWLLWDAAQTMQDEALSSKIRPVVIDTAYTVLYHGLDSDGGILKAGTPQRVLDSDKDWWAQMEAMVGFFNAYQLTGDEQFLTALFDCWQFVQTFLVDRDRGGWYWGVNGNGTLLDRDKAGMWKTPYHDGRACLELIQRIHATQNQPLLDKTEPVRA